jgi:LuxR family quorum-sensing system transcriptional regulator CciR
MRDVRGSIELDRPPPWFKYLHIFVTLDRNSRRCRIGEVTLARIHARRRRAQLKRLVDRFAAEAAACGDPARLRVLLGDAAAELGFDYFALLQHCSLAGEGAAGLRLDNYPEGWAEELVGSDLAAHDPVHLASRRTHAAFAWTELGAIVPLSARQKTILARSRRHGIGPGFTVPANVRHEPSGSCSFAVRAGRGLPDRRLLCAELVGNHAFRAARRILKLPRPRRRPHLSRREVECLRLVAAGKTDWEAARILGISVETARQYVKHARAAYDVVSRTQLVVHGLHDEWLTFEDAIPPSW